MSESCPWSHMGMEVCAMEEEEGCMCVCEWMPVEEMGWNKLCCSYAWY